MNESLAYRVVAKSPDGKLHEKVIRGYDEAEIKRKLVETQFEVITLAKISEKTSYMEL